MGAPTNDRTAAVAGVFDRSSASYDNVGIEWFGPIGRQLVAELAPVPGERALDIGTGRGAVLFPLAAAVGPSGHVTGFDLAPGMVDATAADARDRGLSQVDVVLMNAAAPDLAPASYDVVLASLVLFFLPDPLDALTRWAQLLRPGGRLGITTFGEQDPVGLSVDELFGPYLPPQMLDARTSGADGPFESDEGVEGLFAGAGLRDVATTHVVQALELADASAWVRWSWSHGQRRMWECVPEGERPAVEAAAAERLEAARQPDGSIRLQQDVRITRGVA